MYLAPAKLLGWLFECNQVRETGDGDYQPVVLNLMTLPDGTQVGLAPERLFGRHCAVVGATGVGKSWTLARLMEESARHPAKMILFDSTGEFYTMDAGVRHVHIGADPTGQEDLRRGLDAVQRPDRIGLVCALQASGCDARAETARGDEESEAGASSEPRHRRCGAQSRQAQVSL